MCVLLPGVYVCVCLRALRLCQRLRLCPSESAYVCIYRSACLWLSVEAHIVGSLA